MTNEFENTSISTPIKDVTSVAQTSVDSNTSGINEIYTVSYTESRTETPPIRSGRIKPRPTSSKNPCPVCGSTKPNCRTLEDSTVFCFTHSDARFKERVGDYICLKESNGHTATFKPDNSHNWKEQYRHESREDAQARIEAKAKLAAEKKAEAAKAKVMRIAQEMPVQERDYWHKQLLAELILKDDDKQRLLDRGFTAEHILGDGYRSVSKYYTPVVKLPKNFPGLLESGSLCITGKGILIPNRNHEGLIVSLAVAYEDRSNGKYKPVSHNGNPYHINDEQPVFSCLPDVESDIILANEGGGFKGICASHNLNLPTIFAPAGNFASSPENSRITLEAVSKQYNTNLVGITPDAGDITNKIVLNKWKVQAEFFLSLGYEVVVLWWDQLIKKRDPDIDELPSLENVQRLSCLEFFNLAQSLNNPKTKESTNLVVSTKPEGFNCTEESAVLEEKAKTVNKISGKNLAESLKIEQEKPDKYFDIWKKSQKFTPDIVVEEGEVDLVKLAKEGEIPSKNALIQVNAAMGLNKTGSTLALAVYFAMTITMGSFLNNLLISTCGRAWLEFGLKIYHLKNDSGYSLVADTETHIAACIESWQHLEGYFGGKFLLVDEIMAILNSMLSGATLGERQGETLTIFGNAIEEASVVVVLDAFLTDNVAAFMHSLAPNKESVKIKYKQLPRKKKYTFVDGLDLESGKISDSDKSAIISRMSEFNTFFSSSDARSTVQVLDELSKARGLRGYALHRYTSNEDWAKAFLLNPNEFIKHSKPDYFLMSPSGSTGISITEKHFEAHFQFFGGTFSTNAQLQIGGRVRDNDIPNYVVCPKKSRIKDRSKPSRYTSYGIEQEMEKREALVASLTDEGIEKYINEAKNRLDPRWEKLSYAFAAIDSYEQDNLRKCLIYKLEELGHEVTVESWEIKREIKEEYKEAKVSVDVKKAELLFNSKSYETTLEADNAYKKNPSVIEDIAKEKTHLLNRIPGIDKKDYWSSDFIYECYVKNSHYIGQIEKDWFLNNLDVSQLRHNSRMLKQYTASFPVGSKLASSSHLQIWALDQLGINRLNALQEYHKNSPEVVRIVKQLRESPELQSALGIKLPPEKADGSDRIEIISRLLSIIGKKNKALGQKIADGMKLRHYKVETIDHINTRDIINECVANKWNNWKEETDINAKVAEIESERLREIEKQQLDELMVEWTEAKKRHEDAIWLEPASIQDLRSTILSCESYEEFKMGIVDCGVPQFAIKAAVSSVLPDELKRLVEMGLDRVPLDSYKVWNFCQ